MPSDLNTIVQKMIAAGESEANIALVIKAYKPAASAPDTSMTRAATTQLARKDIPDDVRGELEAIRSGTPQPGRVLGNPRAIVDQWGEAGPHTVVQGLRDIGQGNVARGSRQVLRGGLVTAAPMVLPAALPAMAAAGLPATIGGAVLGTLGGAVAAGATNLGAKALGASDDQAGLASDVAGLVGGGYAGKYGARGATATATRLQEIAHGARDEGLGGALAAAVRTAAPLTPVKIFVKALKPEAKNLKFETDMEKALPDLKRAEIQVGTPITGLDDARATLPIAKQINRAEYDALAGPHRGPWSRVDGRPIARAMMRSLSTKTKLEGGPKVIQKAMKLADNYRRDFTVDEMESLLRDTNAELESYYSQYPTQARAAVRARPEVARVVAQAGEMRKALYNTFDAPGQGAAARELQQRYGALMDMEHEIERRWNVAARQQESSLSEQIGKVRAAGQFARGVVRGASGDPVSALADMGSAVAGTTVAKSIREFETTDALIRRAMRNVKPSGPVPYTPPAIPVLQGVVVPPSTPGRPPMPPSRGLYPPGMGPAPGDPRALPPAPPMRQGEVVTEPRQLSNTPAAAPPPTPPPPDASFVRSVPAQYPQGPVRGDLPPGPQPAALLPAAPRVTQLPGRGRTPPPSSGTPIPLPGTVAPPPPPAPPDASSVRSRPAAILTRDIDPGRHGMKAKQLIRVGQYSSDPAAMDAPLVNAEERKKLQWMLTDLQEFPGQRGKVVNGIRLGIDETSQEYAHGSAGSPVAEDVRVVSDMRPASNKISRAITEVLNGKPITSRLHAAVIDVARGLIERRPGIRGPQLPEALATRVAARLEQPQGASDGMVGTFDDFAAYVDALAAQKDLP